MPSPAAEEGGDPNTMRILLATDIHLGYAEKHPVKGRQGFSPVQDDQWGSLSPFDLQGHHGGLTLHAVCLIRDTLKCVLEVSLNSFANSSSVVPKVY